MMNNKPLRLLACSSFAVLVMCAFSNSAKAQTETVTANLTTSSAISTDVVSPMDFGEWLIQFAPASTPSITLTNNGTAATSQTGVIGGSTVVEIVDGATEGVVNVTIPAPAILDLTRTAVTDFADTNISLSTINYDTATQTSTILAVATPQPVTVVAGNVAEQIRFGGIVTITGTPANATHSASFDVTLAY